MATITAGAVAHAASKGEGATAAASQPAANQQADAQPLIIAADRSSRRLEDWPPPPPRPAAPLRRRRFMINLPSATADSRRATGEGRAGRSHADRDCSPLSLPMLPRLSLLQFPFPPPPPFRQYELHAARAVGRRQEAQLAHQSLC